MDIKTCTPAELIFTRSTQPNLTQRMSARRFTFDQSATSRNRNARDSRV